MEANISWNSKNLFPWSLFSSVISHTCNHGCKGPVCSGKHQNTWVCLSTSAYMHACDATEEHTRRHSEGIKSWFKSLIVLPCGKACAHLHFEDSENKCVTLSCERNLQPLLNKPVFTLHGSQVQMFFCYFKVGRRRLLRAKLLNSTVIRFDCFD